MILPVSSRHGQPNGSLKLISKNLHRVISDMFAMSTALTRLAQDYKLQGYATVRRGPVVVLLLSDGEVHFCPDGRRIMQFIFKKVKGTSP